MFFNKEPKKLGLDQNMKQRSLYNKCAGERKEMKYTFNTVHLCCAAMQLQLYSSKQPVCRREFISSDKYSLKYVFLFCTVINAAGK